jgi:hypothetical protein
MKRLFAACVLLALASMPALAFAQVKEIPGEMTSKAVTIEAIDHGTRELSVKLDDGTYEITARYYTNVVLRVKLPGEKDVDTSTAGDTKNVVRVGTTIATQRTITATITQLDPSIPSITFKGPNNWTYSSKVQDKKAIEKVKVGDKVDITWTEAVLVDVGPPEKK